MEDLKLNRETHTYLYKGEKVKYSVTEILDRAGITEFSKEKLESLPLKVRKDIEYAKIRGTYVHGATALYDENRLQSNIGTEAYLEAWKKFKKDSGIKIIDIEKPVYSKKLKIATTPDRVGLLNGKLTVLEIKCIAKMTRVVAIQTAGQKLILNEGRKRGDKIKDRMAVNLKPNGTYEVLAKNFFTPNDESYFLSCLNVCNLKDLIKKGG